MANLGRLFLGLAFLLGSNAFASKLSLERQKISDTKGIILSPLSGNEGIESESVQFDGVTSQAPAFGLGMAIDQLDVSVDKIINIGKKVWSVVLAGQPVINQTYNVAQALPQGNIQWTDLENWQTPRSAVYRITYKNVYGMNVVDFSYRISFVYGGQVNGVGRYLTGIRVQPANLSVAWGYNFNVTAEIPEVYNRGTRLAPIAAANVIVKWSVSTALSNNEQSDQYLVDGLGNLRQLQ